MQETREQIGFWPNERRGAANVFMFFIVVLMAIRYHYHHQYPYVVSCKKPDLVERPYSSFTWTGQTIYIPPPFWRCEDGRIIK